MPDPLRLLAIGLPVTGKTTFLAALWHVAESGEVPGSLRAAQLSQDAKHLNRIRSEWLRFEPVGRTNIGQEQSVSLRLADGVLPIGELILPDLSGETFEEQWADRHWTEEYGRLVQKVGSLLLFIHPAKLREPTTIAEIQKMAQAAFPEEEEYADTNATQEATEGSPSLKPENEAIKGGPDPKPSQEVAEISWNPRTVPTQVQLVGLLQFVEPHLTAEKPVRLAIVISAWDCVGIAGADGSAPSQWFRDRLPYLDQYLRSNFEQFAVRIYGISAQGGDLKSDLARLQECKIASNRIQVNGVDCGGHDITEPIRWALGLRKEKLP